MNHAEEAAFWYLRLNGIFPITNFVVHRSGQVIHSSDCDVLGVRPPHVFEAVGGQEGDWDPYLQETLDLTRNIGVICEVKSGQYAVADLFADGHVLSYCIERLGLVPRTEVERVVRVLRDNPIARLSDGTQIAKLLIARKASDGPFLSRALAYVHEFLRRRVEKYPKEKYSDRMFFGPVLFQSVIEFAADDKQI